MMGEGEKNNIYRSGSILNSIKVNRTRFNEQDEILLLKEVIANNPYADASKWAIVQLNVCRATGKNVSCRGIREHVQYILKKFEKRDRVNQRLSGIEEPYNELDHLLQVVLELINSILKKKEKIKLEQISFQKGKAVRENISRKLFCEKQSLSAVSNINEDNVCSEENFQDTVWEHSYTSPAPTLLSDNPQTQSGSKLHQDQSSLSKNDMHDKESTNDPEEIIKESQQNIQGPVKRRSLRADNHNTIKKNTLKYLEENNHAKDEIKLRQIKLDERKLELDREKLEFEKAKFDFEKEQKCRQLKLEEEKIKVEVNEREGMLRMISNSFLSTS